MLAVIISLSTRLFYSATGNGTLAIGMFIAVNLSTLLFFIYGFIRPFVLDTFGDALGIVNNKVFIYARSGKLIYERNNYRNDWNGTSDGRELPEGAYYYLIDFEQNGTIDYEGWLYLTR